MGGSLMMRNVPFRMSVLLLFLIVLSFWSVGSASTLGRVTIIYTLSFTGSTYFIGKLNLGNPNDSEYQRARLRLKIPEGVSYELVRDDENNLWLNLDGRVDASTTIAYTWIIDQGYRGKPEKPRKRYIRNTYRISITPLVRQLANELPDRIDGESLRDYLIRLMPALRVTLSRYRYGERAGTPDRLIKTGQGVCEDFAALTVALLRVKGLKSRVVVGYPLWEVDLSKVRFLDLKRLTPHAWVEVFIDGYWYTMEMTPSWDPTYRKGLIPKGWEPRYYLKLANYSSMFHIQGIISRTVEARYTVKLLFTPYRS